MGNTKLGQQVVIAVYNAWKAFIQSTWDYRKHKDKYKGIPKMPNYLGKKKLNRDDGRYIVTFDYQRLSIPELRKGYLTNKLLPQKFKFLKVLQENVEVKELKIVPVNTGFDICVSYIEKKEIKNPMLNNNGELFQAGIDLGISNLAI